MFELSEIEELANQVNLSSLYEIAKNSAQIGNDILKINYNKIQKISSKGRKGDLVTNVDLEVENKIKEYLLEETPNISINAEDSGKLNKSSDLTWCIDPLDGTTNYSHGYPFSFKTCDTPIASGCCRVPVFILTAQLVQQPFLHENGSL